MSFVASNGNERRAGTNLQRLIGFNGCSETIDRIPEAMVVEPGLKEGSGVAGGSELEDDERERSREESAAGRISRGGETR